MNPIPPPRAIAIAMLLSVTVSIGELTCGGKVAQSLIEVNNLYQRRPQGNLSRKC